MKVRTYENKINLAKKYCSSERTIEYKIFWNPVLLANNIIYNNPPLLTNHFDLFPYAIQTIVSIENILSLAHDLSPILCLIIHAPDAVDNNLFTSNLTYLKKYKFIGSFQIMIKRIQLVIYPT